MSDHPQRPATDTERAGIIALHGAGHQMSYVAKRVGRSVKVVRAVAAELGLTFPERQQTDPTTDPTRHAFYGGRTKAGQPCAMRVIEGTKTCRLHAGKGAAVVKAEGQVVVELERWGLGDTALDPGVVLLRLVTQSAWRVERYAAEVQRKVDEAGGNLEKALTGDTYTTGEDGRAVKTGEYIRAMTRLEAEERDRCANFSAKAVAAGLAERQVRLAERQGAMMAGVFGRVLDAAGLSDGQRAAAVAALGREITALTGGPAIEGSVA